MQQLAGVNSVFNVLLAMTDDASDKITQVAIVATDVLRFFHIGSGTARHDTTRRRIRCRAVPRGAGSGWERNFTISIVVLFRHATVAADVRSV